MNRMARAMKAAWGKIKTFSRGVVLLVLVLVAAGLSIFVSSEFGTAFVRVWGWAFQWAQGYVPEWPLEILAATGNGILVLGPALGVSKFGNPAELLGIFWDSLSDAGVSCLAFVGGEKSWLDLAGSLLKPGLYVGLLMSLLGWYGVVVPKHVQKPFVEANYVVSETDPDLLPVHLHVNFDNATLDENKELTDQGTTLDAARKATLQVTVDSLSMCGPGVNIKLYGFASEAPFFIDAPEKNNKWNVKVADHRARAVYEMLNELAPSMTTQEPEPWDDYEEMTRVRKAMIPVPEGSDRDAFADRVVVIYLSSPGDCTIVQNAPQ